MKYIGVMKVEKTKYYSWKIGKLPKGCRLCVKGQKSVLFITGLCPKHCYYCPISEKKAGKDVVYINERGSSAISDVIEEIKLCSSKGVGITGGDPLVKVDRTVEFIKKLKKKFGRKFHIHLYTPMNLVNFNGLEKLFDAGLDEIRFHLDSDKVGEWEKIGLGREFGWDVGVEIPAVPGKLSQVKKLIGFLDGKVDFLNINELEYSDTNASYMGKEGFKTKNDISYGIKGSEEMALSLLRYCKSKDVGFDVHYCSATLKDKVQLAKRIKGRAMNVKKEYDFVDEEGILVRGAIYFEDLKPGFSYREKLEKIINNRKIKIDYIKKLNKIMNGLMKDFKIKKGMIGVDENKLRILTSVEDVVRIKEMVDKNLFENLGKDKGLLGDKELFLAVVEEYPTFDQLELSVEFL